MHCVTNRAQNETRNQVNTLITFNFEYKIKKVLLKTRKVMLYKYKMYCSHTKYKNYRSEMAMKDPSALKYNECAFRWKVSKKLFDETILKFYQIILSNIHTFVSLLLAFMQPPLACACGLFYNFLISIKRLRNVKLSGFCLACRKMFAVFLGCIIGSNLS